MLRFCPIPAWKLTSSSLTRLNGIRERVANSPKRGELLRTTSAPSLVTLAAPKVLYESSQAQKGQEKKKEGQQKGETTTSLSWDRFESH